MRFPLIISALVMASAVMHVDAIEETGQCEPLLTPSELAAIEHDWRQDLVLKTQSLFEDASEKDGTSEDAQELVDFYHQWMTTWLREQFIHRMSAKQRQPSIPLTDWRTDFMGYFERTRPQVEEFLKQKYMRYHEDTAHIKDTVDAFEAIAVLRMEQIASKYPKIADHKNAGDCSSA